MSDTILKAKFVEGNSTRSLFFSDLGDRRENISKTLRLLVTNVWITHCETANGKRKVLESNKLTLKYCVTAIQKGGHCMQTAAGAEALMVTSQGHLWMEKPICKSRARIPSGGAVIPKGTKWFSGGVKNILAITMVCGPPTLTRT